MVQDSMPSPDSKPAQPKKGGMLPFLIDFGPLLIFFAVFKFTQEGDGAFAATAAAIRGTLAFMVAITIALAVSKWKLGKISPMLWMSAVLVIGFGALTIYFHDREVHPDQADDHLRRFCRDIARRLVARAKPMLKYLLEAAYDGLDETGWMKLSRNWGLFFGAFWRWRTRRCVRSWILICG